MMNCADYQELLQSRLDGDVISESPESIRHLEECPQCRALEAAAVKLMRSFGAPISPIPPSGLSEQIVRAAVRARRRHVVVRTTAVFAMAAGVMLAVYAGFIWSRGGAPESPANPVVARVEPRVGGAAEFRSNVESAYGALTGIVNQTAEKALEPGRVLLPDKSAVAFLTETAKLQQPQVPSLRGAGQGVAEFAPVTSLGRFFNYFAQDIPGMEPKGKSDS